MINFLLFSCIMGDHVREPVLILFSIWGELCFLHSPILARLAIIKKVSSECINP